MLRSVNMKRFAITLCLVITITNQVYADGIFGDFGGYRSSLSKHGVEIESIFTMDYIADLSGGLKRDEAFLGNYDLTFTFDTGKLGVWDNGTLFLYFLGNFGDAPTEIIGDLQGSDNIEAPETFKLFEAWYEHTFFDGKFSFLVGLHDLNSEFYALDNAAGLLNSSFGIGIDASQPGPSIFPTTALAARTRILFGDKGYFQAAAYDGIPGDPNNDKGTHVILKSSDGIFWIAEGGVAGGEDASYYKAALGGWYHTTDFEDFSGVSRSNNYGAYLIAEKNVLAEADPEQGLGLFFQFGYAKGDRNQTEHYLGFGCRYTGALPGRDQDVFSFGVAAARNSDEFLKANPGFDRTETAIEATYNIVLSDYFSVTPDFQYIINPGTDSSLDNAVVLGIRTEIAM
ncbi:MAG: carbohydrate porin [Candidatus Dadabacteria bacterium]|nr:MAG: carbohydrate porin [Candidatus Dadabacteria bacterium]